MSGASTGRTIAAAIVLFAAAWAAFTWWPSEERRVRTRLAALEDAVNDSPPNGLELVARAARLATFFDPDVVLDPGNGAAPLSGREQLVALTSRAQNQRGGLRVSFVDVRVAVTGTTATSHLTATIEWRDVNGQPAVDAREATLDWKKTDQWRITRITAVEPLERPR